MQCNVNIRKLLSAHKSYVRETSLFTGAIPNPIRNSQTSLFVSVPGQYPGRSSGEQSMYSDIIHTIEIFYPKYRNSDGAWSGRSQNSSLIFQQPPTLAAECLSSIQQRS